MDDLILFNIKSILSYVFKKIKIIFMIGIVFSAIIMSFLIIINKDKEKIYSAQNTKTLNSSLKFYNDLIKLKKTTNNKEVKNIISAYQDINCHLTGEFCSDNPKSKNFYNPNNLSFKLSNLLFFPFLNPPSSFIGWTKNTLSEAGFLPKTYAYEGIGFASLKPLISLWRIFRDFSFMIIVLVLVAIGFMIMFRTKINPQTVISVENSLPKIILALILVTFSFPIAGLLYDLTNVVTLLIISLLAKNAIYNVDIEHYQKFYLGLENGLGNEIMFKNGKIFLIGGALLNIGGPVFNFVMRIIGGFIIYLLVKKYGEVANNTVQNSADGVPIIKALTTLGGFLLQYVVIGGLVSFGISFFIPLIISIFILFTGFYIYIKLLVIIIKSYITNIILTIISPLILIVEAVPGKNTFGFWLKSLIGNLIIFPIITFVIILSNIIINSYQSNTINISYLPTIDTLDIAILISFGLVFLIPDFINTAREFLGIKKSPINFGLGTFFMGAGAGLTGIQQTLGGLTSLGSNPIFGPVLRNINPKLFEKIFPQTIATTSVKELAKKIAEATKGISQVEDKN